MDLNRYTATAATTNTGQTSRMVCQVIAASLGFFQVFPNFLNIIAVRFHPFAGNLVLVVDMVNHHNINIHRPGC